jgi:hypothetical protein
MNRNKWYLVVVLNLVGLMVMPAALFVNHSKNVNIAEGSLLPPPPPMTPVLVAEGTPIPPPMPPVKVAEGTPIPPPMPPVMVAEGTPIPPPMPPGAAFTA